MKTVGIISQARMTSTRLPGKVLLTAGGRTMLDHHLDRLACAAVPIYVATTTNQIDDAIVERAQNRGLGTFRGSEDDVLARYLGCAEAFGLEVIVRVTSDCPLIDGALVGHAIEQFLAEGDPWLYLSNALQRSFPRGMDFEVFSLAALRQADRAAVAGYQREHVTPYMYQGGDRRVRLRNIDHHSDRSSLRLTLDTAEDYALLVALIEQFGAARLSLDQIVTILDDNPQLVAINHEVEQKRLPTV